jgi:hypothetical protein
MASSIHSPIAIYADCNLEFISKSLGLRPVDSTNMPMVKAMVTNARMFVVRGHMWIWVLANQHIVYFAKALGLKLYVCSTIKVDGYR